jgi:hypothetical protein
VLEASCRERRVSQVTTQLLDLDGTELPEVPLDGGWCRWVFAFVRHPRDLLARVARRLKPGAVFVVQEYFDYGTWRLAPRSAEHEEFVATVMRSWRDSGGEPDIGLQIPGWLNELGFAIRSLTPLVDVVPRSSPIWQWPRTFIRVGLERLVSLARMSSERAEEIWRSVEEREAAPGTLMVTPAVLEIVAERVAP